MLFDTHLHMDDGDDPDVVLGAARQAGVTHFAVIGTTLDDSRRARDIAQSAEGVVAAAGIHPHAASCFDSMDPFLECYAQAAVAAVGEIGLDYHYDHSPRDVQRRVFARFLQTAAELGLPAVIHCRDAFDDCLAVIRETVTPSLRFVLHSFTGTPGEAEEVLALGGLLSVNGMVTFRRADNIRETLAVVPMDRLLLETDAPYLAPVPHRGKRNTPAYLPYIAGKVATEKGLGVDAVSTATTANAQSFFAPAAGNSPA